MIEQMEFPITFEEFAKEYGFKDKKEVYTNGDDLIPIFRVKQWIEHDNKLRKIETDTAYECGKHANKWISVNERLPEQYGNYLVSIDGDEIDIGTIDPDAKNKGWSLCDANGFYWATEKGIKITAWMPLPKPYNESEVEKYET